MDLHSIAEHVDPKLAWDVILGFGSVVVAIFWIGWRIGRKISEMDSTVKHFDDRNHEDHQIIALRLDYHKEKVENHADRLGRIETKLEMCKEERRRTNG